jgi:protein SCO1/2
MIPRILAVLIGPAFCLTAALAVGGNVDRKIALAETTATHSPASLPGDSLYQLPIILTTASGASLKLAAMRGRPALITMFYGQCTSVCPLLTMQLQRITQHLSRSEQLRLRVLMVSFDSARDTPESLTAFAHEHQIIGNNWTLARASASDIRSLAATLGIQYRELPDHTFNHSTLISLVDPDGVIRDKTSDLSDVSGDFVTAIRRQLLRTGQSAKP